MITHSPRSIPVNLSKCKWRYYETNTHSIRIVIYNVPEIPDDFVMAFHQQVHSENGAFGVDNERCKISEIDINGNTGRLFEYDNGDTILVWSDNEYVYSILAYYGDIIGTEDVIEMAREMK